MKELVYHRQLLPALDHHSEVVGFHDGDYHATFGVHGDRVLRLADSMSSQLGLKRGARFAVLATNSHRYLELYHAGFLGAGVINPLNLRLRPSDVARILEDSGTEVVFTDWLFAGLLEQARRDAPGVRQVVLMGGGDVPHDIDYESMLGAGEPRVPPEPDERDPVVLMYTGGTTGLPKGALLDQRAEMLNLYHISIAVGLGRDRVFLHQTPMFHAASIAGLLGIPASGGVSVFIPLFDPARMIDAVEAHGVNMTVMVPTMIAMLLDHPDFRAERLASLEHLVYGASPMPEALVARIRRELPTVELSQGYGMTESASVLTLLTEEDHRAGGPRLRSAGRPLPGVAITIQDPRGRVLAPGETGEVCARGGNLMTRYWNRPDDTERAFRDGWYHTGDIGRMDEGGYLYLVDRVNDMIVSGGENIYSIEVENAIASHPAVHQVAVIGVPDDVWGERVHAIVVSKEGAEATVEEIAQHARARIAGYKVPKSIELRKEPLPLSGAMKPLKRELRRPYWEGRERSVG